MTEEAHPSAGENGFERIDPKLNMFALANGLDLIKSDRARSSRGSRGLLGRPNPRRRPQPLSSQTQFPPRN